MGPTFATISLLYVMFLLFSKMFHYPYFFTLKYHLHNQSTEFLFLLASLARILEISYYIVPGSRQLKHLNFIFLTKRVSLFCLYFCHIYYSVYLLSPTTKSNDFVFGKALLSLFFSNF